MSLFGEKRTTTFQRAKERAEKYEKEAMDIVKVFEVSSSSGIGEVLDKHLDKITGPLTSNREVATTSEIAHKLSELDREDQQREFHGTQKYQRLKAQEKQENFETGLNRARIEDDLRRREHSQTTSRIESGQLQSDFGRYEGIL